MAPTNLQYADLVSRYGAHGAFDMLVIFEKSARLRGVDATLTEEQRLQIALQKIENDKQV
jgi:hypothetical protein